jgi:osomolarity two-component system response regulator SKN7
MPLNMPGPGQPDRKPQKAEMPQSGTELPGSGVGSAGGTSTAGGDGVAAGGAACGTSVPSEFIKKLYKMLEKGSATCGKGRAAAGGHGKGEDVKRGWVGWGRGGTSFVVWDINGFTTKGL